MFSLRIHSLDSSLSSPEQISSSSSAAATATSISPSTSTSTSSTAGPSTSTSPATAVVSSSDPLDAATASTISASQRIQIVKGIAHLYRSSPPPSYASIASSSSASNSLASPDSLLPAWRGKLLFVVAVPYVLSPEDFVWVCDSYIQLASKINFIRNDGMEDRYSVLLEFEDQLTADRFYRELNGWKFPSSDVGEVCHVLYLVSAEYTNSLDFASTPPIGSTELPTCPICIERLDQDTSGIINTSCDHSFQCPCVSKWVNSSCPVCHLCQNISAKPRCSICMTNESLWICIICGFVGCSRYKKGHALKHWKNTNHCYTLDLERHRVWDYVGNSYVHRLNDSKIENKNKSKNKNKLLKFDAKGGESGHSCASDDCECNIEMASIDDKIKGSLQTTEVLSGTYKSKINYEETKHLECGQSIVSPSFMIGGHAWSLVYYPNGRTIEDQGYISLILKLQSDSKNVHVLYDYTILYKGMPFRVINSKKMSHIYLERGRCCGPYRFLLLDDCFDVLVNIIVLRASSSPFEVPPSDLHEHIGKLLYNKERCDVTLDVEGELFYAHKLVLAARSEVFNAQLFGSLRADCEETIRIGDMKAVTFKALLHFIYTDSLPDENDSDSDVATDDGLDNARASNPMTQHLLVAADQYGLERLKLICEEKLCKNISVDSVATTLALADQHNCPRLKETCFKFATIRENYIKMTLTDGFVHLLQSCPSVIKEFHDVLVKPQFKQA